MSGDQAKREYSAAVLVIGNEVLSGRVHDANLPFLAARLKARGIRLREARVVADTYPAIIGALDALRAAYDYVLTTGGIGPTHDDITADAVARAFGRRLRPEPRAVEILERYYGDDISAARLRMANTPEGAELLDNPVSMAPGFRVENVYVLPGVPSIMQAIFDGFEDRLAGGAPLLARTVTAVVAESRAADGLAAIQGRYPEVEIGSYPQLRQGRYASSFVVRGIDEAKLDAATTEICALVRSLGAEPEVFDRERTAKEDRGD